MSKQVSLMSPTLLLLLLAAAVVCCSLTAVSGLGGGMVGGRTQVKDVKTNQEVQDLGRYSVKQFNRMQKAKKNGGYVGDLRFQEVVEAETQVVSGVKYYLKISAVTPAGVPKTFDAVVVVKPWTRSKELLNFDPSPPSY